MKKYTFPIIILLVCIGQSVYPQQERGMQVVVRDPATGEQIQMYENSWALLIGINKYQNVNRLDYAVPDAQSIGDLLTRKFAFKTENITSLFDDQATKANITEAFSKLLQTHENDRLVVFYAGHGTQYKASGGGEMGYLVPVDGKATNPSELYNSCISMQELRNLANMIPAKHILFLVDACYGGLAAISSRALKMETQQYLQKISVSKARQIITAGGRGEQVIEKSEWGHSAFTYKLLEGLDKGLADLTGDYLVTASELFTYLKPAVTAASENRQTPVFKAFSEDEGEFVFVLQQPKFTIDISSNVPGAAVKINGNDSGKTPLKIQLERGEYTIEISKPGYKPFAQKTTVTANAAITAQLLEDVFELAITSNPAGGQVFINGVERGTTALIVKMKPGKYSVQIEREGYENWNQDVDIITNHSITAELIKLGGLPPVTELQDQTKTKPKNEEARDTESKAKESELPKVEEGSSALWWVIGGAAVVGGASYFLFAKKSTETSNPPGTMLPDPPGLPKTLPFRR